MYIGYPSRLLTDQVSVFAFQREKQLSDMVVSKPRLAGVNAYSYFGAGEPVHEPPAQSSRKMSVASPNLPPKMSMKC